MRILVTRPIDEAQRTARRLIERGHDARIAPVLRIEPLIDAAIGAGPWSAVLMTSGNAARALIPHARWHDLIKLPVFAVGRQTAEAASRAGFSEIISADGDSGELVALVSAGISGHDAPLLYLAGSDISRDLAAELAARGGKVETVVLYRATAVETFDDEIKAAMAAGAVDGVLHYSRRSAAIFVGCAHTSGLLSRTKALTHFCLSDRAAEPLRDIGASDIRIARRPDEDALIDLLPHS